MNYPKVTARSKIGRAYEILNTWNGFKQSDDRDSRMVRLVMAYMESVYSEVLQEDILNREKSGQSLDTQKVFEYKCQKLNVNKTCDSCEKEFWVSIPTLAQYNGVPILMDVYAGETPVLPTQNRTSARLIAKGSPIMKPSAAYYVSGSKLYFMLPGKLSLVESVSFSIVPISPSSIVNGGCFDIWSDEYPVIESLWPKVRDRVQQRLMAPNLQTLGVNNQVNDGM